MFKRKPKYNFAQGDDRVTVQHFIGCVFAVVAVLGFFVLSIYLWASEPCMDWKPSEDNTLVWQEC